MASPIRLTAPPAAATALDSPAGSGPATTFLTADFAWLSAQAGGLYRGGWTALRLAAVIALYGMSNRPENLLPFVAILLSLLLGIGVWTASARKGLPLFPLFMLQQGLTYGLPLVLGNEALALQAPGVVTTSSVAIGGFLLVCLAGWQAGRQGEISGPSKGNLALAESPNAADRCLGLALALLGISAAYLMVSRTGLIWTLLPGSLSGLMPVYKTVAGAAAMLGALFGGLVVGHRPVSPQTLSYWTFLALNFLLLVADVLISAGSAIVLSAAVGLALGMRKVPWKFLLVALGIVGFLNQGKFVMRERYWSNSNVQSVPLSELPAFYMEWAGASSGFLLNPNSGGSASPETEAETDDGQSIFDRVNNLQNMTFIVSAMEVAGIPSLGGETYTLIPKLLIPRFLWADKPRTHEGQVLLNLHFGRQANVRETEMTYIAWGFLPEAVGNFGIWLGPILLGGVLGWIMGRVERISLHKRFFSLEGMVLISVLVMVAGSYEMVASVFVTAMFQMLVAVTLGGLLLLAWFGKAEPARRRPAGEAVPPIPRLVPMPVLPSAVSPPSHEPS